MPKKKPEVKEPKLCPFAVGTSNIEHASNIQINQLCKCLGDQCQCWDDRRKDCGLKSK